MKIMTWMLMRMIAVRFVAILLGISIFVLSLEVVTYTPRKFWHCGRAAAAIVAEYMLMRSPGVLATFLPISMLLAMLLVLTELELSQRRFRPCGRPAFRPLRIVVLLLPLGVAGGRHAFSL